ncbi:Alstrom syndrome protein 1 [Larimichthys crocea]|uniref:Alstrom syndrome protein 1 n=1 Tax=Larimichthys crocea TaxID=215358 RepID=A0A6G0IG40_LARCR|nr:Alstrom syndrome protein 1 [Larimichthys crocea]
MSTVDTARLIRAFGAHRVRHLKTSSTLSKLYDTINKQRDGREQRRGRRVPTPDSESNVSSSSTSTLPPQHGASTPLAAKKVVKEVSWFISADELRAEGGRRTSEEEGGAEEAEHRLVKPYSREALELRRPEFISRSRQRVERLRQEDRKLHEAFSRERHGLFSRAGRPERPQRPAGGAQLTRAVPRKEMIQRSKQIYENLPEVQRRREDERRRAEYRSNRLNAQLFNKRITGRLLGRRAWQ